MNNEERDYSEYEFDTDIKEHNGFAIGDEIEVVHERPDAEDTGIYEGMEGVVVGFSTIPPATDPDLARAFGNDPAGRTAMYVIFDDETEPVEVRYDQVEVC